MEGIIGIKPEVKKIAFTQRGIMDVHLAAGRTVTVPLAGFRASEN